MGYQAGYFGQTYSAIAIGERAGFTNQKAYCTAIGSGAGQYNQDFFSIAMGFNAGSTGQSSNAIAIGQNVGSFRQSPNAIAIGNQAGQSSQLTAAIAIGQSAGNSNQGRASISIGRNSGQINQGSGAVSVGENSGNSNQGTNSIAIGTLAGYLNQAANSIVLNAAGTILNAPNTGFFVSPIRTTSSTTNVLVYDTVAAEIRYNNTAKSFVIEHPSKNNHYLVHACLEGPEAGVYYRGEIEMCNKLKDKYVAVVELPDYVIKLAKEFTVHVNPVVDFNDDEFEFTQVATSTVKNGKFKIYTNNPCKVNWLVFGKRFDINVEIDKNEVEVKGDGPYKWI
jgi:hypothetical protein